MKNKKVIIIGVIICAVVLVSILGTYAFFLVNLGYVKNEVVKVQAGTMELTFSDNDTLGNIERTLNFGDTVEKELKIENSGTLNAYAKISWDALTNTFTEGALTYTLEYKTSETGIYQPAKLKNNKVPISSTASKHLIVDHLEIPAHAIYIYKITITYNNLDVDQTSDLNATFSTKFTLDEGAIPSTSVMTARQDFNSTEKIWGHSADIKEIIFEDKMNPKAHASYTYDMSENQDGKVMSYLVPTEDDATKYTLYIQGEHGIVANSNSSNLFFNFPNLESIEGLVHFDTSNVTNMHNIFFYCNSLTSLDLSNFDTRNVTDMGGMFYNCIVLTSLNLSNFDTSNVTDMSDMFSECNHLTTLDVSNFDTRNVTDMSGMFADCSSLTALNLGNFDTSRVTNMESMFNNCNSLGSLDLSNFNVTSVTSKDNMLNTVPSTIKITVNNNTRLLAKLNIQAKIIQRT